MITASLFVVAAPSGDDRGLDDDDASSPAMSPFDAAVSARDIRETAATDVRQPMVVHGNDATHPLAVEGSFAFSAAAAVATNGRLLGRLALQASGSLLLQGLSAASAGQRLANSYLQALARRLISNADDFAPFAWTLTDSFSNVFAGNFRAAATAADDSSSWEDFTGDLDLQPAVAAAATSNDDMPSAAPRSSVATRQQQAAAWDAYFAEMAAVIDQTPAED